MAQELTVGMVRMSYVNVFEPKKNQQGVEKYSVTCLLPKSDVNAYNAIMAAIEAEKTSEATGKLKGVNLQYVKTPIHDGDGVTQNGTPFGDECKGHWVFTASASADKKPLVVDASVQPIIDRSQVYSGMYGYVAISIYAYDNNSKGIGFGLNAIQKVKDGEPLGYSFDVNTAFTAFNQPQAQPTTQAQPNNWAPAIDPITGQPM